MNMPTNFPIMKILIKQSEYNDKALQCNRKKKVQLSDNKRGRKGKLLIII